MNILTFDIEDWYLSYQNSQIHYSQWDSLEYRTESNAARILDFLGCHHLKGTFFMLGYDSRRNPGLLRRIHAEGHDIGFHSIWHKPIYAMKPGEFRAELRQGLDELAQVLGFAVRLYRAPAFSLDNRSTWAPEILMEEGIRFSSSVHAGIPFGRNVLPELPFVWQVGSDQMMEFPIRASYFMGLPWRLTGSGYFRIMPVQVLRYFMKKRNYNMFYFHPRDVDPKVPSSDKLPLYRNLVSRMGNNTTIPKLETLLRDFTFISLSQAASHIKQNTLHTIPPTPNPQPPSS